MSHDVSIILSTYLSDNHIKNYYNNINELINIANIQLVHILNEPTKKETLYKEKFLKLQNKKGIEIFEYKYLIVKRESLYASWNRAIKLSDSKLITISNVDDIRYNSGLRAQIEHFRECSKLTLLGSNFNVRTEEGLYVNDNIKNIKIIKKDFFAGMYVGPFFMWNNPTFFGREPIFFDEQFYVAGDFDFQIRFASIGTVKMLHENVGEYLNLKIGLSTGSVNQSIECQVIYQRYNVIDKKIAFFSFLFFKKTYFPTLFKIGSMKYVLNEVCPKINFIKRINSKRKKNYLDTFYDITTLLKMCIKKFILNRK
jgi:hypothetical protein